MTFLEWLTSSYPNPSIHGQWGLMHILTLATCIIIIVAFTFLFRSKSVKTKKIVLWCFVAILILFEVARRVINFSKTTDFSFQNVLYILLPRPWCAISVFLLFVSMCANKRFMYNFVSITGLVCAIAFFAYPGVGFNNQYILFENLYSIATHCLILICTILMITLGFTKFEFKTMYKELVVLACVLTYALFEIYVLKIENDPMYLSPELVSVINRKTPDADGLYILDMDSIKDKILFYIEVVNNELGATLERIKSILNKNSEVRRLGTKDAVTQELVDTIIEGGLSIDAIHLEVILSHQCKSAESNLLEPDWTLKNATYRMISLNEALKDNPSVTVSLMYKDINKLLYYPLSFQKSAPSVLDLFYMTKPQNYMSIKPEHSTIIDDKEVEGPIKPFVIRKDEFDEEE